ncbi:hypothetical protein JTB14_034095 [Gonioctena quinquepunctata]|nr:hypothetical protein JTB14_034095 [Gonioctena quinquepunctata]
MRNEPDNDGNDLFVESEETEIDVLAYVQVNINTSLREIARECNISKSSAANILKKHKYHSFKYQLHQNLYQDDNARRLEYCNWFFGKYLENTDESCSLIWYHSNRNNKRYWSDANLPLMEEGNFQERFGFHFRVRILAPIIFDGVLTGARYLSFLTQELDHFLEEVPLLNRVGLFYQQDGASPHNLRAVTEYLHETYNENWIENMGPVRWPPRQNRVVFNLYLYLFLFKKLFRTPDLTPLDFFMGIYQKRGL